MESQDQALLEAITESLIAEDMKKREQAKQKDQEEKDKVRKAKEDEEKQRKMEFEAQAPIKPKRTKLTALIGQNELFDDVENSRFVFEVLRQRLHDQQ